MENQILDADVQNSHSGYAGFWLRFAAVLIDGLIMGVVFFVLGSVLGVSMFSAFEAMDPNQMSAGETAAVGGGMTILMLLYLAIPWLYFALQESSATQATIGKKALGLKVTDMHGDRITFLRATGRHFGKYISGIILYIGYIMAGFTDKKQALHDMMASCLVVKK